MRVIGWLRRNALELGWLAFAAVDLAFMVAVPGLIRVPFFLLWISLVLVYGFRPWPRMRTAVVVAATSTAVVVVLVVDHFHGDELTGKLLAVPLLALMFSAMAWHARRHAVALEATAAVAEVRASLLERQQQFLADASHELRTPVTIARGHLELLQREQPEEPELEVALDELGRMEGIVERLLFLARAGQPGFLVPRAVDIEAFLGDVFLRWSGVAPRAWRLDVDLAGRLLADPEALRNALDALLENAVKHTDPGDAIELAAHADGAGGVVIEVSDSGSGVPPEALPRIFDRWARVDDARTRERGGAGLGLAIVAAVARAHGGRCSVKPLARGTAFRLHLPVRVASPDAPNPAPAPEGSWPAPGVVGALGGKDGLGTMVAVPGESDLSGA
jgi:signal transduction histidine kinase